MKDLLLLLVLLDRNIIKVCSLPYQPDSKRSCLNASTEYLVEDVNLCCQRCPPGSRWVQHCSKTKETQCEPCDANQYTEKWNYSPTCFSCHTCKFSKGLQFANNCLPTRASKCKCMPGKFCILKFHDPYCSDCQSYSVCPAGSGVAEQGTANSNVKCRQCPEGTFSDTASSSHPCRPHTRCHGRVIINGNSTSDTLCEPEHPAETTSMAVTTMMTVGFVSALTPTQELTNSTVVHSEFVTAIGSAFGIFFVALTVAVIVLLIRKQKKYAQRYVMESDANGNCETGYEISQDYSGKAELRSGNVNPPERHFLLLNKEADQSECSGDTDPRRTSLSRHESIGPLRSTMVFNSPPNPESVTSLSDSEPISPHIDSSQPHIVSPVASSPQVNVNITFHINGSCGSVKPTDVILPNSETSLAEEEEHFSIPQQEAGKEFLLSVEEEDSISK